jgi:hypothetical protein
MNEAITILKKCDIEVFDVRADKSQK